MFKKRKTLSSNVPSKTAGQVYVKLLVQSTSPRQFFEDMKGTKWWSEVLQCVKCDNGRRVAGFAPGTLVTFINDDELHVKRGPEEDTFGISINQILNGGGIVRHNNVFKTDFILYCVKKAFPANFGEFTVHQKHDNIALF